MRARALLAFAGVSARTDATALAELTKTHLTVDTSVASPDQLRDALLIAARQCDEKAEAGEASVVEDNTLRDAALAVFYRSQVNVRPPLALRLRCVDMSPTLALQVKSSRKKQTPAAIVKRVMPEWLDKEERKMKANAPSAIHDYSRKHLVTAFPQVVSPLKRQSRALVLLVYEEARRRNIRQVREKKVRKALRAARGVSRALSVLAATAPPTVQGEISVDLVVSVSEEV